MIACGCEVCTSTNPKDNRLRSSILIETAGKTIVIDTTPDFRTQMLREKVKTLDAVIFTHSHKDHIAGLDDIKAFNYFQQESMDVYADAPTQAALKNEFHYIFASHKYPGVPDITLHEVSDQDFFAAGVPVTPIKVWHLKMPVLGFRFGDFTYITDANRIDDDQKEKIKGSKIIVLNALRHKKHLSHFTLQEALDLQKELGVPQAYFTHISHQLGLHAEVSQTLPPGSALAYDGLVLHV